MTAYYNEFDSGAAAWLRELIKDGLIADGEVDERSIADVQPSDLREFSQVHLFAGIGGWSYALRLAGWPDARPVWTGSCPCQPFSCAGKRKAESDHRHLLPEMFRLIRECRPQVVFGEQVASSEVVGSQLEAAFVVAVQAGNYARANKLAKRLVATRGFHYSTRWIDRVQADMASQDYAVRFKILGAHSVKSPHIRKRAYWVADNYRERQQGEKVHILEGQSQRSSDEAAGGGGPGWVADAQRADAGLREQGEQGQQTEQRRSGSPDGGATGRLGNADQAGQREQRRTVAVGAEQQAAERGSACNPWSDSILHPCRDGKLRRVPVEHAFFPLASGISAGRVGILRGAGNAIVPQVAAAFIESYCEVTR